MTPAGEANRKAMKADAVITVNDPDDLGERVVRYLDVRCPDCGRMFFCVRWEATGYPEVHCPPCGRRHSWPFEEIAGLEQRYSTGEWPTEVEA
jgi:ribosomal protein S27E